MSWTTPSTWVDNAVLMSAQLDAQLSANLASLRNSNDHLVQLYLSGNQNILNNTNTMASWNAINGVQIGSIWSLANPTRLVAPVTGYYQILVNIEWGSGNSANSRNCSIIRNSVALQCDLQSQGASGGRSNLNGKLELLMTAGTWLEVQCYQNSGSILHLHGGTWDRSRVAVRLLGT